MTLSLLAIALGLSLMVWSSGRFVHGAGVLARHLGMPPLLIGMVVVGFGTSAPELAVSIQAALDLNPGLALGNAFGSNIANIALILGLTALISPIAVHSGVVRRELPLLTGVTILAAWLLRDGTLTRGEGLVMLGAFAAFLVWTVRVGARGKTDPLGLEMEQELDKSEVPVGRAVVRLVLGLVLLLASSRLLVWGAVRLAEGFGVGDLVIGLTIVAVGTSLPELASSVAAVRRKEHDLALGNVIGSNLFNTLAVAGAAGAVNPLSAGPEIFRRDIAVMGVLTIALLVMGLGVRGPGRINRFEGAILLACFVCYTVYLVVAGPGG